jgi:mercuric ion binding protein
MTSNVALAEGTEVKVKVNGMVCGFCAQGITKKFKSEASVQAVDVRLGDKLVKLNLKSNQDISDARINQILSDSGYNVEKIERN